MVAWLFLASLSTFFLLSYNNKDVVASPEKKELDVENYKKISRENNKKLNEFDIRVSKLTYSINTGNLDSVVKDADMTMIVTVDEINETDYRHPVEVPSGVDDDNLEIVYTPYTNYSVTVIESLSGEFSIGEKITVYKAGGLNQYQEFVELLEGDTLLEVGKEYIVNIYIQDDGSLLISGHNSSIETSNDKLVEEIQQSVVNLEITEEDIAENQERISDDVMID